MNPVNGVLIYVLIWWVTLFAVLPMGVRGQAEEEDVEPGTEPGAPLKPQMGRKVFITSAIAAVIWLIIFLVIYFELIDFDNLPFMPDIKDYTAE